MSANVRRLESEKAASKDELARLTTQRDEARQEVVSLMREAEKTRKIEERMNALEKEHADISQRHQTTLELLGEKSEQVEELKADILDVKQMYRQLADTMK
jgi:archaellum component FlaC